MLSTRLACIIDASKAFVCLKKTFLNVLYGSYTKMFYNGDSNERWTGYQHKNSCGTRP